MKDTGIIENKPAFALRSDADLSAVFNTQPRVVLPPFNVRRIVMPFDGSSLHLEILQSISSFAQNVGATIHLLSLGEEFQKENRSQPDTPLQSSLNQIPGGIVATYHGSGAGAPDEAIVAHAVSVRADLVVMTNMEPGSLKQDFQRSTAERVSRSAPCPVLTIPEKCAGEFARRFDGFPSTHWKTIFMPVDFSFAAAQGFKFAAAMAIENRARLLLVHGNHFEDGRLGPKSPHQSSNRNILSWAHETLSVPVTVGTTVWLGGHSLYAILSEARRENADIIILPTRAHSWATRFHAGSITDGILRHAPCPVLTIHENTRIQE